MDAEIYEKLIEYIDWQSHDWSVSYTPWGERLICRLTIEGVTRSGVGDNDKEAFYGASFMFTKLRNWLKEYD